MVKLIVVLFCVLFGCYFLPVRYRSTWYKSRDTRLRHTSRIGTVHYIMYGTGNSVPIFGIVRHGTIQCGMVVGYPLRHCTVTYRTIMYITGTVPILYGGTVRYGTVPVR